MKAVRVHAFDGVDTFVYEDVPIPEPGPGEVLVRVAAAGVRPWTAAYGPAKAPCRSFCR